MGLQVAADGECEMNVLHMMNNGFKALGMLLRQSASLV